MLPHVNSRNFLVSLCSHFSQHLCEKYGVRDQKAQTHLAYLKLNDAAEFSISNACVLVRCWDVEKWFSYYFASISSW